MRISQSRHIKVNLGNYESADFGGTVTIEHGDLGYTDEEVQQNTRKDPSWMDVLVKEMKNKAEEYLDLILIEDIKAYQGITEETRSILLRAFTNLQDDDQPTERRSTRRPRRAR